MAQDTSGTNLVANSAASVLIPIAIVEFKWDGSIWTDESGNFVSATGQNDIASPRIGRAASGAGMVQQWSITLANHSARYSPTNASSPIYANIQSNKGMGVEVRISAGYRDSVNGDETLVQFLGVIDQPQLITNNDPMVTYQCIGLEYKLLENKIRTTLGQNVKVDDWITTILSTTDITDTDLDEGIFNIPYAWADNDAGWADIQRAAASESGYAYLSKEGQARFENAWHWLVDGDHATSVLSLDGGDYQSATLRYEQHEVFNSIESAYTPRAPGAREKLFELAEFWTISPGETRTFKARFRKPVLPPLETPIANESYIVVDDAGINRTEDVVIVIEAFGQEADVQVTNNNTTYEVFFRQFTLYGVGVISGGTQKYRLDNASSPIGDPTSGGLVKRMELNGDQYAQTIEQAEFNASIMIDRASSPRLTIMVSGCPARPYLEIGDRITLDVSQQGFSGDVFVTSIAWRLESNAGYFMDLTCVEADGFFRYGRSDYFIIGTDSIAAGGGTSNRVFH